MRVSKRDSLTHCVKIVSKQFLNKVGIFGKNDKNDARAHLLAFLL